MNYKVGLSLLLTAMIGGSAGAQSTRLEEALSSITEQSPPQEVVEEVAQEEVMIEPRWTAEGLNENESKALAFFQDYGITDRMALAVIMGNIRQESNFHSNICEGGARVKYDKCYRGGYGLVQWTTSYRYWGLGNHAKTISGDPSTIETQLSYLVTEREWKEASVRFKTPEKSLDFYMKGAYRWLGWGIFGNRGYYSQQYYDALTLG